MNETQVAAQYVSSLDEVEVGSKVIVHQSRGGSGYVRLQTYHLKEVTKVTKTRFSVGNTTFTKADGKEYGGTSYRTSTAYAPLQAESSRWNDNGRPLRTMLQVMEAIDAEIETERRTTHLRRAIEARMTERAGTPLETLEAVAALLGIE